MVTFVIGINVLFITAVHGHDRWFALEEALDVLVVIELVVAWRRLRGRFTIVVFVMGRDLTKHHAVVLLQQGIA